MTCRVTIKFSLSYVMTIWKYVEMKGSIIVISPPIMFGLKTESLRRSVFIGNIIGEEMYKFYPELKNLIEKKNFKSRLSTKFVSAQVLIHHFKGRKGHCNEILVACAMICVCRSFRRLIVREFIYLLFL